MSKSIGKVVKVASLGVLGSDSVGGKSKAPKAPNYSALATQQSADQQKIAEYLTGANRPSQEDAFGNYVTWSKDPATGAWKQSVGWSQGVKDQFKGQIDAANTASGLYKNQLGKLEGQKDFKSPTMPTLNKSMMDKGASYYNKYLDQVGKQGDFKTANLPTYDERNGRAVSDATYNAYRKRAVPEQQRRTSALDAQLRMQGVQPGTEAYDRAMRNQMTSNADADYQAAQQATLTGYDEARQRYMSQLAGQGQQFQQDLTKYQMPWDKLNNMQQSWMNNRESGIQQYLAQLQGQGQQFGQKLTEHNQPWQQAQIAQGMASDRYTPQMPGFSGATGWNAADQVGAANANFSNRMAGYNSQQQKKGQTLGAGAQLGAAALLSDERLKDDIAELDGRQALEDLLAIGGYSWTWKEDGTPDVGVLAQRVQKVMQDAVDAGGEFLRVNYTTLVGKCIAALGYLATKGGA